MHPTNDLFAYIENRLAPEALAEVELHLQTCETCRVEVTTLRETQAALVAAGQLVQRLPVTPARSWTAVHRRWQSPIVARVRSASGRVSWPVMFSIATAVMVFVSSLSLNMARAATPSVPAITTPNIQTVQSDTATFRAPGFVSETPTRTLTPSITLTPAPIITN